MHSTIYIYIQGPPKNSPHPVVSVQQCCYGPYGPHGCLLRLDLKHRLSMRGTGTNVSSNQTSKQSIKQAINQSTNSSTLSDRSDLEDQARSQVNTVLLFRPSTWLCRLGPSGQATGCWTSGQAGSAASGPSGQDASGEEGNERRRAWTRPPL